MNNPVSREDTTAMGLTYSAYKMRYLDRHLMSETLPQGHNDTTQARTTLIRVLFVDAELTQASGTRPHVEQLLSTPRVKAIRQSTVTPLKFGINTRAK